MCYISLFEGGSSFDGGSMHEVSPSSWEPERMVEKKKRSSDRGLFVQETDRALSAKMRQEHLSEKEFEKRAEAIKTLRLALVEWASEHVEDNKWDQRKLLEMTNFLSREHAKTIDQITKDFSDQEKYPTRPVVKLMLKEIGTLPDVFLFGWRGKDPSQWERETKIHDHADSTVALTVHEGAVDETVYVVDHSHLLTKGTQEPNNPRGHQNIPLLGQKTKRYPAGLSKSYKSPPPYLHTVAGSPDFDLTVTVHAYLRPSVDVAYDFAVDKERGLLYEIGVS